MHTNVATRLAIALLLASHGVDLAAAEPIVWKFAKGKAWQTETERTATTISSHPGSDSKIVSKTNIVSKIVVDAVDGDVATVTETVSAMRATVEVDNKETVGGKKTARLEKVEYDSANPNAATSTRAAKSMKAKLEPLVGKSETYQVDARGQRIELPSAAHGERPHALGGVLLPQADAADDATWTSPTLTVATPTAAKLDISWKRESAEGGVVKLSGVGTLSSSETTLPWQEASYAATADFSKSAGVLVSSETTFIVSMKKVVREKNVDATTTVKTVTTWKELPPP